MGLIEKRKVLLQRRKEWKALRIISLNRKNGTDLQKWLYLHATNIRL